MDDTHTPAAGGRHRAPRGTATPLAHPGAPARARGGAHAGLPAAAPVERCPSCASRVGPREEWCSLCHASLRTAPVAAPADELRDDRSTVDELPVDELPVDEPAGPSALAAPGTADGAEPPELDDAVVDAMLAELSGAQPAPGVRGLRSPRTKVLVAAVGGVGLTGLLLLAMTAAGAILG